MFWKMTNLQLKKVIHLPLLGIVRLFLERFAGHEYRLNYNSYKSEALSPLIMNYKLKEIFYVYISKIL